MSSSQQHRTCLDKEKQFTRIAKASARLLAPEGQSPNSEELCATMAELSGAKYVVLNSFDQEQKTFTTQALWGEKDDWMEAAAILGMDSLQQLWPSDPCKAEMLQQHTVTYLRNLEELFATHPYPEALRMIQRRFFIGAIVVVRVQAEGSVLGDFTLLMEHDAETPAEDILSMYASQVGLYLAKKRADARSNERSNLLEQIVEATKAGTWEWYVQTGENRVNDRWAELIGFTLDELEGTDVNFWYDRLHPDDRPLAEERLQAVLRGDIDHYSAELRLRHRNGHYIWILDQGKVVKRAEDGTPLIMLGAHFDIHDSKTLAQEVRASQEHYQVLVESSYDIIYRLDLNGRFTYLSKAWTELLGHTVEEAMGGSFHPYVHPEDLPAVERMFSDIRHNQNRQELSGYRLAHSDGSWHYYTTNAVPVWNDEGQIIGYTGTARDITDLTLLHRELMAQKEQMERFFAVSLDLLCITDIDGRFLRINHAWSATLGYSLAELQELSVLDLVHPDDTESTIQAFQQLGQGKVISRFVNRYRCKNGEYLYLEWRSTPHEGQVYGAARDVTEQREKQKAVEYLSMHDYLTGLYNRRYMTDSLARLDTSRNYPFSIVAIDVNGLKLANDTFGHSVGDELLAKTADILRSNCRSDDIVCRIGGDEFVILLPQTDEKTAAEIRERIDQAAKETEFHGMGLSLAIGFATKTRAEQDIFEVQKQADTAMYQDKLRSGRIMRDQFISTMLASVREGYAKEQVHTERVADLCERIAQALGMSVSEVKDAKMAGALHDIGKVTVRPEALNKQGPLDETEWEDVRRHPVTGYHILKSMEGYAHLADAVLYHHERPDGKGYPEQRKGENTPILSRIITVADAYEAMTADRDYRKALTPNEAREELRKGAGTQFDSTIVDVLLNKVLPSIPSTR